jgi:uncharacterized delta-60 repeat protein
VQKDGKILVGGYIQLSVDDTSWGLVRYKPGGTLDQSFGDNGRVITNLTGGDDWMFGVANAGGGRIIAGGYAGGNFAAVRYTSDGHLDHSFSGDGKAFVHFASGESYAYAMAKSPGGKIVLAGQVNGGGGVSRFGVARLTSTGAPDSSFGGGDGKVTTDLGPDSYAYDVVVNTDGSIVAAGDGHNSALTSVGVAWYQPNGALDEDKGDHGMWIQDLDEDFSPTGMVALASGKIVVAGPYRTGPGTFELGLVRVQGRRPPGPHLRAERPRHAGSRR